MRNRNLLILGVVFFIIVACKNAQDNNMPQKLKNIPPEEYLRHLDSIDSMLDYSLLKGWSAECRTDDFEHYALKYDTSSPTNLLHTYGEYYYVDCFNISTGKSGNYNVIDTLLLCMLWDIDGGSYNFHVKSVCEAIKKIVDDYEIDILTFYKNGNIFYSSSKYGWNLFFLEDTTSKQDSSQFMNILYTNGYKQLGTTLYWLQMI